MVAAYGIGRRKKAWFFDKPETTKRASKEGGMGTLQLIGIIFFCVCGGPYGCEAAVKSAGPLITLIGFILCPFVWGLPMGLMAAELACAMPTDGGFVLWVYKGFGPFVGFVNGILVLMSAFVDNAAYPILAISYLTNSGLLPDDFVEGPHAHNLQFAMALGVVAVSAILNIFGVEIVGTFSYLILAMVLLPFIVMIGFCGPYLMEDRAESWSVVPDAEAPGYGVKWGLFLSVVLWATAGWDESGSVAERVQDPARSYTNATLICVFGISIVYLVPIAFGVTVVPWNNWTDATFEDVAQIAAAGGPHSPYVEGAGRWLKVWLALAAFLGCAGTYVSLVCTTSLGLKCLGELQIAPAIFAHENEKTETPIIAIMFTSAVTGGMCYFSFDTVVQVGVVLYSFSLFMEWGSVLTLRYFASDMARPFVIPLKNGYLCIYWLFPMGLCVWTTYSVISDAIKELAPCTEHNSTLPMNGTNSTGPACDHKEGMITLLGIGGSFMFSFICYSVRGTYRFLSGTKGEEIDPAMFGITTSPSRPMQQSLIGDGSSIQEYGSLEY